MPVAAHTSLPWRIHDIAPDFEVLDVWSLPTPGGRDDFARLVALIGAFDPQRSSPVVRGLFTGRWALGRALGWDGPATGIGSRVTSLRDRLPPDLLDASPGDMSTGRFSPVYVTADEAALEIANRTVHGVLHLGWVADRHHGHRGQLTVLVKPNGALGAGYLSAIAPFRHLLVYPAMLRAIAGSWRERNVVSRIEPPQGVRELSSLPRVDYADAFLVQTGLHQEWTAERWARATLEESPAKIRVKLTSGWAALGLTAAVSGPSILGWEVRRSSAEVVLLGRTSKIGMPGELLFARRPEGLLFATFVHHRTAVTRWLWATVTPAHVRTVSILLKRAGRAAATGDVTESSAGPG